MRISDRRQQTVAQVLERTVASHGDRPFLLVGNDEVTFADLDRHSNRLGNGLHALGIRRQQNVLLMLEDNVDFIALWIALAKLGAVEVPINRAHLGDLLIHLMNDSQAQYLIVDARFLDRIAEVCARLTHLPRDCVLSRAAEDSGHLGWWSAPHLVS